ncbi:hypothetical protein J7E91_08345 [Streptomyces sp. ISL-99]|uniref:hypothetical protein n=1 Tax=Streptomyces sp. ISL-99 TaxID=2819193 RepID=UPI001BEA7ED2|nr:hypothetical protein [Streptomyces sp. ISL-99]MBT2525442.1 hypothetical protein [Streptomyces sp. ISL-99]
MVVRSSERLRAAEDVVAQLREGLGGVAVTLPSLRVDLLSLASEAPYPLVDLGRCNLDTALRLAAVLQGLKP